GGRPGVRTPGPPPRAPGRSGVPPVRPGRNARGAVVRRARLADRLPREAAPPLPHRERARRRRRVRARPHDPDGVPDRPDGRRTGNFATIEATIGGETYPFVLDTGATLVLTNAAEAVLGSPRV